MREPDGLLAERMSVAVVGTRGTVRRGAHGAGTSFAIRRINAGRLVLPTGRVSLTDAYSADAFPPLNRIVPPGAYPVELVVAELPANLPYGNDRCAFAVVTFSDDRPASWSPVTAVAPAAPCFTDDRPNRVVQEGGTGLSSPEAGEVHFAKLHEQFDERLGKIRGQAERSKETEWVNYRPGDGPANVIICEGGWGDGNCECFVGPTKLDRVARLVVDFGIAGPTAD